MQKTSFAELFQYRIETASKLSEVLYKSEILSVKFSVWLDYTTDFIIIFHQIVINHNTSIPKQFHIFILIYDFQPSRLFLRRD